jgi:hypothetical protein
MLLFNIDAFCVTKIVAEVKLHSIYASSHIYLKYLIFSIKISRWNLLFYQKIAYELLYKARVGR